MPSYRASFGKGFMIGAGAAALWAIARYYGRRTEAKHQLIDWERATAFALQACGSGAVLPADEKEQLQEEYEEMVRGIEGPISQYTGTELPLGNTTIQVMDRGDWIRANVNNF